MAWVLGSPVQGAGLPGPAAAADDWGGRRTLTLQHAPTLQDFLKVFEALRDDIVNDELLAGQPESSKQWVKEVRRRSLAARWEGAAACVLDQPHMSALWCASPEEDLHSPHHHHPPTTTRRCWTTTCPWAS